jgi:hypothetical protein
VSGSENLPDLRFEIGARWLHDHARNICHMPNAGKIESSAASENPRSP